MALIPVQEIWVDVAGTPTKIFPPAVLSITISADLAFPQPAGTLVTFTAAPVGGEGAVGLQWKLDGVDIAGATGTTYGRTVVIGDDGKNITCEATDSFGQVVVSAPIAMSVVDPVTASIAPVNPSVTEGQAINFVCTPGGGNGTYAYQWRLDGVNIGGATAATYNRTTVLGDNGKVITCQVISDGQSVISNSSTMTVNVFFDSNWTIGQSGTTYGFNTNPVIGDMQPRYIGTPNTVNCTRMDVSDLFGTLRGDASWSGQTGNPNPFYIKYTDQGGASRTQKWTPGSGSSGYINTPDDPTGFYNWVKARVGQQIKVEYRGANP